MSTASGRPARGAWHRASGLGCAKPRPLCRGRGSADDTALIRVHLESLDLLLSLEEWTSGGGGRLLRCAHDGRLARYGPIGASLGALLHRDVCHPGDARGQSRRLETAARSGHGPVPATRPLGICIHVPFCTTRCGYCDFNTTTAAELGTERMPVAPICCRRDQGTRSGSSGARPRGAPSLDHRRRRNARLLPRMISVG